jgi:hypothetical protein
MSKFVFSPREISSSGRLIITVIKNLPFAKNSPDGINMIGKIEELMADLTNTEIPEMLIETFNQKHSMTDGPLSVYMNAEGHIVLEVDEDLVINTNEAIEEEIPTLVGLGITIAGALMMIKSRFESLGNRIEKLVKSYRHRNYN